MSVLHTLKSRINPGAFFALAACLLLLTTTSVFAEPYLQLDASHSIYMSGTWTGGVDDVVTTTDTFTLYALVNGDINRDFYISAALTPAIGAPLNPAPDYGSFTFDGETLFDRSDTIIDVTGDMDHGTPPVAEEVKDLAGHGIFPTYYKEFKFSVNSGDTVDSYNSQDDPGGFGSVDTGKTFNYAAFEVNVSGLSSGYGIQFDLFTVGLQGNKEAVDNFAPFSHNVMASKTPVPNSVLLGVVGLCIAGMKLRRLA